MDKEKKPHTIDILFVITLFAVFALSIMSLTGIGAGIYSSIVEKMTLNYGSRTTFSYVVNKIHQSDESGRISMGSYDGFDALIISEDINNITYCTYLYEYEGELKELFTRQGQVFDPKYATTLIKLDSFDMTKVTDTLYKFEYKPVGLDKEVLFVHIKSGDTN
ncbi:MAG: DUF4860 domain-containing protein [Lachnospiraceae bacterium]|nr:DUF4860 domain-containing protein [Lachnospiraceae bacterium]